MNRWRRSWTVATFEFLTAIKRRGYLIGTFGMPLFMAAYGAVVAVPAYFATQKERETSIVGVVDPAAILKLRGDSKAENRIPEQLRRTLESAGQTRALERIASETSIVFRPYGAERDARAALAAGAIKGYFVVSPDYLQSGKLESYTADAVRISSSSARDAFARLIREHLLEGRVDGAVAARVLSPLGDLQRFGVTHKGEVVDAGNMASAIRIIVPVTFMVLFLVSVLMTSGYLMQGTATEKENKVVDVLLASANPDEVLAGKLLGLGAAGLLQVLVWFSFLLAGAIGIVPLVIASRVAVPWLAMAFAFPLFVTSFLFFGSLMLGTGSLGSNMREAQQLAMVWSLTAALPLMMIALLIRDPHGVAARIMTWLPVTSAAVVMLRASLDPGALGWMEVAGAFIVLIGSTWLAIRLGARLFRIGLLSSGSRPTLREIMRQARLAD
jgi:ABC-2 type transport system permease protein